jgi:hypothetical protein
MAAAGAGVLEYHLLACGRLAAASTGWHCREQRDDAIVVNHPSQPGVSFDLMG